MYKKKRYAKVAQLLKPSRTNKVQLLFAYNSLLVGKVVAIAILIGWQVEIFRSSPSQPHYLHLPPH